MSRPETIWLDHAATSWPKPPIVLTAVTRWFEELGCDASRGSTWRHQEVRRLVNTCRSKLGTLCGVAPEHVVFCSGATEAINLHLRSTLAPGDTVWTTSLEHNSVARPLEALRQERDLRIVVLEPERAGAGIDPERVRQRLEHEPPPRLVVFNHVSNVTGAITDLGPVAARIRDAGGQILADCAQSAGRLALSTLDVDALAFPAHKGLQGPPGLGVLALRPNALQVPIEPLHYGGTGSSSPSLAMPDELPLRLEAGTPNTPAIVGLLAGIEWITERGIDEIHRHERAMTERLRAGLADEVASGNVQQFGGEDTGVIALAFRDLDPHEVAMALAHDEIYVRAGFHCTTLLHDRLGAPSGTVRLSPGPTTTTSDIDTALRSLLDCV
ncbi:MAG: aminotransferase class V-fold PLP-dependent enzyme [Planctomycetes bacterium]|nr:aminotransferase class V-fold PLP-dependent enzyme [Planctomycetota bacterium]